VMADIAIPFDRPRAVAIGDTPAFNQICASLRGHVAAGHAAKAAA